MYKSRIEKAKEKSNKEIQQAKREAKEMIDNIKKSAVDYINEMTDKAQAFTAKKIDCLLYTSPSPRD